MTRKWIIASLFIALVGVAGLMGYRKALELNLIRYNKYDIRSEGVLQVGDLAPDLALASADGSGSRHLSEFWGSKTLVLVFGSYT